MTCVTANIAPQWITAAAAVLAFLGVVIGLWVNGARAERQRRRDLHARALAAITAYGEMPYRISRRAPGTENRAKLSDELSEMKAELEVCQVLLAADGDRQLSAAFDQLCIVARRHAGRFAHEAWLQPPPAETADMNRPALFEELKPYTSARDAFADDLRVATLPRLKRTTRWLQTNTALPGPTKRAPRRTALPHDRPAGDNVDRARKQPVE